MSNHLAHRAPARNKISDLPDLFFERQAVVHQPATRAGMHLVRRYHVHPAIADTLAVFAGIGSIGEGR
jgi:hypothetical protein